MCADRSLRVGQVALACFGDVTLATGDHPSTFFVYGSFFF